MGWWHKAKEIDSTVSLLGWGPTIIQFLFPGLGIAALSYLATFSGWLWNGYGTIGAISAGLVGTLIISASFALIGVGYRAFWPHQFKTTATTTVQSVGKVRLTKFDLEGRQRVLQDYADLATKVMEPLYLRGIGILQSGFGITELFELLDSFKIGIVEMEARATAIWTQHQRFENLLQSIDWSDAPIMAATDALRLDLLRLKKIHPGDERPQVYYQNKFVNEWQDALQSLNQHTSRVQRNVNAQYATLEKAEIVG